MDTQHEPNVNATNNFQLKEVFILKSKTLTMGIIKTLISFLIGWFAFLIIFAIFFDEGTEEVSSFHTKLSALLSIVITILFMVITNYNKIFRLQEIVKARLSIVEIEQKKCKKLIDQANDVLNRYMQHEKDTHQNVAKHRSGTMGLNASNILEPPKNSKDFQGLIENYPDLKANVGVQQLLNEIITSENAASDAKKIYNNAVADYNFTIHSFPVNLICRLLKLKDMEYYSEPKEDIKIVF